MAQIMENGGGQHDLKKGRKQHALPSIDMTPMVDLAFLLLTFFVLTSTFSKPQAIEINMPLDGVGTILGKDRAITILLAENNAVYWYRGVPNLVNPPKLFKSNLSARGIRKVLLEYNNEANQLLDRLDEQMISGKIDNAKYKKDRNMIMKKKGLFAVIKATNTAKYRNMVDLIDEMQITNVANYAIVDIQDYEKKWISEYKDETALLKK